MLKFVARRGQSRAGKERVQIVFGCAQATAVPTLNLLLVESPLCSQTSHNLTDAPPTPDTLDRKA